LEVQYGVVLEFQILPLLVFEECLRTEGMRGAPDQKDEFW
jgi:hypothetical protein